MGAKRPGSLRRVLAGSGTAALGDESDKADNRIRVACRQLDLLHRMRSSSSSPGAVIPISASVRSRQKPPFHFVGQLLRYTFSV